MSDKLTLFNKQTADESMSAADLNRVEMAEQDNEALQKIATSGGKIVSCPAEPIEIPGIAAAAFDADDCLGTIMKIAVPKSGELRSATYLDLSDQGGQVDLEIYKRSIAQAASNAAYAPTDVESANFVTELNFVVFDDHGLFRTSEITNIGKGYTAPEGYFYIQAVNRGTNTIAAGALPRVQLQILSDDPTWQEV